MKWTEEELKIILDLCQKKAKGIKWVLEEKEIKTEKKEELEKKKNLLLSLIKKIELESR